MLTVLILAASAMFMQKSGYVLAGQTRLVHESRTVAAETIDATLRQVQLEVTEPGQSPPNSKSEATAILLSLSSTIVPIGVGLLMGTQEQNPLENAVSTSLVVAGGIGGPLAGYIYSDETSRGLKGLGTRCFVALGFGIWALADHDEESYLDQAILPLFLGSVVVAVLDVKAIAKVDGAVRDHNAAGSLPAISISPEFKAINRAVGFRLRMNL